MNKRTKEIIRDLSQRTEVITLSDLEAKYSVSQRTLRNDIKEINSLLTEQNGSLIHFSKGGVIQIPDSFDQILPFVYEKDFYSYRLSKRERQMIAASCLINAEEYITLASIADNLFVSRATIINDLPEIKTFLKAGNLEVISHPNKGLRVEGTESHKRMLLLQIATQDTGHGSSGELNANSTVAIQAGSQIVIQKILHESEHVFKSFLTDGSFTRIRLYLNILLNRNLDGEYIEPQPQHKNSKYEMAQHILGLVSQYCNINITEDEVVFFSRLLAQARYMKERVSDKNFMKIQMISRQFIESISRNLEVNLNNDYDFFENLSNHLESIYTDTTPHYQPNSAVDEVLEENQEVLQCVHRVLPVLTQHMSRPITDMEIAYIAIHVCAALERKKNKEIAFHVIVACHAGIGTSQLLLERLKKHFNFHIVDIISAHEARSIDPQKADFIISTVQLKGCQLDYVVVSPMLNDEDYMRVGNKIDALRNSRNLPSRIEEKEFTARGLMEKIAPIVWDTVPDEAELLLKKLRKAAREYFKQPIENESEIIAPYLHNLLPKNNIRLDVSCKDWREAVRESARRLLELGYIEDRYIDAMIRNIEENGPYIVLSKGFAVPHEGVDKGSLRVGMSLIRLKEPVEFGDEDTDPVEFVCCLSAVDKKMHLKAFFNLINLLQNPDFKESLRRCRTGREAASVIEKFEYDII